GSGLRLSHPRRSRVPTSCAIVCGATNECRERAATVIPGCRAREVSAVYWIVVRPWLSSIASRFFRTASSTRLTRYSRGVGGSALTCTFCQSWFSLAGNLLTFRADQVPRAPYAQGVAPMYRPEVDVEALVALDMHVHIE